MFYAGYLYADTEVAVFKTKKERDEWVNDPFRGLVRVPLTRMEAIAIIGKKAFYIGCNEYGIDWIINPKHNT